MFDNLLTLTDLAQWPLLPFSTKNAGLPEYVGFAAGMAVPFFFVGNPLEFVESRDIVKAITWYGVGGLSYLAASSAAKKFNQNITPSH